jgi:sulfite oxidase
MSLRFLRFAAAGAAVGAVSRAHDHSCVCAASVAASRNRDSTGACRGDLPNYPLEDVRSHLSAKKSGRVWVTYKCGVYDVTEFIEQHPGGVKRIMLAAGGDIERFWKQFTIHDDDGVRDILERHRIGNVKDYKAPAADASGVASAEAQWAKEPERSPALIPLSKRPFNAETPEGVLDEYFTPNDMFFVRNHMPVPVIENPEASNSTFCLQVEGEGLVPRCFSIGELKSMFPHRTVVNTIQCGGNRRSEMAAAYSSEGGAVKGLSWSNGGIGTASWTGVPIRDVIQACRVPVTPNIKAGQRHVLFEGADKDPAGNFNVSVPWESAMDRNGDAIVAFEMNGEPIPRDHGYPLRAIVPGTVGVRNCKWLQRIRVQNSESQSVWQQHDYKNFPPWMAKPDPSLPSVYAMPIQSSVTDASYDSATDAVVAKGYAYAGGGNGIQRVDVSFDGGQTFEATASILPVPAGAIEKSTPKTMRDAWSWRQILLHHPTENIKAKTRPCAEGPPDASCYSVCFKATADDQATQPAVAQYNFRGLLYNGYSCRDVKVE